MFPNTYMILINDNSDNKLTDFNKKILNQVFAP